MMLACTAVAALHSVHESAAPHAVRESAAPHAVRESAAPHAVRESAARSVPQTYGMQYDTMHQNTFY